MIYLAKVISDSKYPYDSLNLYSGREVCILGYVDKWYSTKSLCTRTNTSHLALDFIHLPI